MYFEENILTGYRIKYIKKIKLFNRLYFVRHKVIPTTHVFNTSMKQKELSFYIIGKILT